MWHFVGCDFDCFIVNGVLGPQIDDLEMGLDDSNIEYIIFNNSIPTNNLCMPYQDQSRRGVRGKGKRVERSGLSAPVRAN